VILDFVTFVVLIVIVVVAAIVAVKLGALPGKIAAGRDHPQAEAINVCGWLGLLTLGLLWPVALIWAYCRPAQYDMTTSPRGSEDARVAETAQELAQIAGRLGKVERQVNAFANRQSGDS